jgi:hypothetical protein
MSLGVAAISAAWATYLLAKLLGPFDLRRPSPRPPSWAWDSANDSEVSVRTWLRLWVPRWTRRPRVRITWRQLVRLPSTFYRGPVGWLGGAIATAGLCFAEGWVWLTKNSSVTTGVGYLTGGLLLSLLIVAFLRRPAGGDEKSCAYRLVPHGYSRPEVDAYLRGIQDRNDVELAFVRFTRVPYGYNPDGVDSTVRAWRAFRAGVGPDPAAGRHRTAGAEEPQGQRSSRGRAR